MVHNKYFDLIDQSYYFPQDGFDLEKDELIFNTVNAIKSEIFAIA